MNCLSVGLPETLTARPRPAAAVTSVNTTPSCASRRRRQGRHSVAAPAHPRMRRNSRRDRVQRSRSATPSYRCAPLLLQIAALALELLEDFERLPAFLHPAQTPIDTREHVVVR